MSRYFERSTHMQSVQGIHHITAIASDPQRNLDFYHGLLGQRLVKKTVNFDDPG
ncbi:MAG: VOC family protein, partial [Caldilineaceae bacterium]|nr:VOC family protein [Caldilineaceae bacterium]